MIFSNLPKSTEEKATRSAEAGGENPSASRITRLEGTKANLSPRVVNKTQQLHRRQLSYSKSCSVFVLMGPKAVDVRAEPTVTAIVVALMN